MAEKYGEDVGLEFMVWVNLTRAEYLTMRRAGCKVRLKNRERVMSRKITAVLGGIVVVCGLAACSGDGPNLEEGMWEITTEVDMPGMAMKIPPMVYRQCLSKEDIVPKQGPVDQEICTYSSPKTKGDRVSWSVECKSPGGKTRSDGEITYRGTSFDGTLTMNMSGAIQMSATNRMSGRRVGDCQ